MATKTRAERVTKNKPRGFAAEEPVGWMVSTMASLGDEGDQCIPLKVVVNTGAEVTVLSTEVYNRLQEKPPVRRQVTMLPVRGDTVASLSRPKAVSVSSRRCP